MSSRFRIDNVVLQTDAGDVTHEFRGPLTVFSGPVGVGKSTLFELIKFALGGSARIAPAAQQHVVAVSVKLRVDAVSLVCSRPVVGARDEVTVTSDDPSIGGVFPVGHRGAADERITIGDLLMRELGLPERPTVTTRSRTSRITFNNVWSYVYIEQREIDRSIAKSGDQYAEPARRATFELLFGITDPREMTARAREQQLQSELLAATTRVATVREFLAESTARSAQEAREAFEAASSRQASARSELGNLRHDASSTDAKADVVRSMVLSSRAVVADLEASIEATSTDLEEKRLLAREYERRRALELASTMATEFLAPIGFVVCPRCTQSITDREVQADHCILCLQPEPIPTELFERRARAESERIDAQASEVDLLLESAIQLRSEQEEALKAAKRNLAKLERLLDDRTRHFVSPRLEAYADASAREAEASATLVELESVLRQWDIVHDLEYKARGLAARLDEDKTLLAEIAQTTAERRVIIVEAIDTEFRRLVGRLAVPGITSTSIDERTYLPFANGTRWDRLSTGGITTALACAYWVALVSVALRHTETVYPGLLIIDTPRKSIGTQNAAIVDQLYRELDVLAATYPDRFQVIVADNDVPMSISQTWHDIRLTYEEPSISTVPHPGEANVSVLEAAELPTDWVYVDG